MERLFIRLLQMSLTGGVVILAVLLLRLVMRRAPAKYRYLLWCVPAFRLCIPVSLPSPLSLFRLLSGPAFGGADYTPKGLTLPLEAALPASGSGVPAAAGASAQQAEAAGVSWISLLVWIWAAVLALLLIYSLVSGLLLRRRLATAVRPEHGIYQASGIDTPFVLGLIRPRIYIPWGMEGRDLAYALAHERTHLRRGDQWWRLLAWLILCVHWYNPLCWLAFFLMGRDMELSCDEAVLEHMGDVRGEYSESLLRIAGKRRLSSPGPLAFGETGVSSRVRNVLRWRHARRWVTVTAMLLCVLFTVAWVTDPAAAELLAPELTVNGDGTLGALRWGMTPEEILAADSRFEAREDKYGYVWMGLEGATVLGHTGDIRLCFTYFIIDEQLHRSKRGMPMLNQIVIDYPGEISLRTELTALFGEPVKHQLDYSREPEIVDGVLQAPFKSEELPEEEWYWLSDETALDLIPLEHMRIGYPKETDSWLQAGFCSVFVYQITVDEWETETGTVTSLAVLGNAEAYQRFLEDEYARRTEDG